MLPSGLRCGGLKLPCKPNPDILSSHCTRGDLGMHGYLRERLRPFDGKALGRRGERSMKVEPRADAISGQAWISNTGIVRSLSVSSRSH